MNTLLIIWFSVSHVAFSSGEDHILKLNNNEKYISLLQREAKTTEKRQPPSSNSHKKRMEIEHKFKRKKCTVGNKDGHAHLAHKHMSKCGGTTMLQLFPQMTKDYCEITEIEGLTEEVVNHSFVIAGVRNPCDYYVSLWSYQHDKSWAQRHNKQCDCFDFDDENRTNVEKFHKWMNWVLKGEHGIMTYRFWETLVAKRDGLSCYGDNLPTCSSKFNDAEVKKSLSSSVSPPDGVSCWVYTEHFNTDLRKCLQAHERHNGVALNWRAFDKFMEAPQNESPHKPCGDYFSSDLAARVKKKDKYIFDAFKFNSCCA